MRRLLPLLFLALSFAAPAQAANWNQLPDNIVIPRSLIAASDSARLNFPDTTLTTAVSGGTAFKVILGSLFDPVYCTNYDLLRQAEKNSGLGIYNPDYFAVTITTGQDSLIIWDTQQMTRYLIFIKAASNMLGASAFNDVVWKNGILTVGTSSGVYRVNLLTGVANLYSTAGISTYAGTLAQRNSASGYLVTNASPATNSNSVIVVSVNDDPQGKIESTGFPSQWWSCAYSATGIASVYNPYNNGIWDGGTGNTALAYGTIPSGGQYYADSNGSAWRVRWNPTIFSVTADAWTNGAFTIISSGFGFSKLSWGNAAIFKSMTAVPEMSIAGNRGPLIVATADSGMYLLHPFAGGAATKTDTAGVKILINTLSNGPPEFGDTRLAVQFDSLSGWGTNKSPYATNLTASGTHTSVNGVVGKADSLSSSGYWARLADATTFDLDTGSDEWAFTLRVKSINGTNPGAAQYVFYQSRTASGAASVSCYFNTNGTLALDVDDATASSDVATTATDFYDGQWHQLVGQRKGYPVGSSTYELYVDGELAASIADNAADAALTSIVDCSIGSKQAASYFTGVVDEGTITAGRSLTANEIRWAYGRGLSAFQSAVNVNDALTALPTNYVTSTRSGYIALGGTDSLSILNQYGIPVRQIASPGGNIQSVALQELADSLSIAIGTTTRLQVIQPDPRISQLHAPKQPLLRVQQSANPWQVDSTGFQGLFWNVADAQAALQATGSGRSLVTPATPVFQVEAGTNTDITGDNTLATIVWSTEIVDRGSNFSSNTFTAPLTGNYLFTTVLALDQAAASNTTATLTIVTGNRTYYDEWNPVNIESAASTGYGSLSVIADMDAGDTAVIKLQVTGVAKGIDVISGTFSTFSGTYIP